MKYTIYIYLLILLTLVAYGKKNRIEPELRAAEPQPLNLENFLSDNTPLWVYQGKTPPAHE